MPGAPCAGNCARDRGGGGGGGGGRAPRPAAGRRGGEPARGPAASRAPAACARREREVDGSSISRTKSVRLLLLQDAPTLSGWRWAP